MVSRSAGNFACQSPQASKVREAEEDCKTAGWLISDAVQKGDPTVPPKGLISHQQNPSASTEFAYNYTSCKY
jgi:hypothetical protein